MKIVARDLRLSEVLEVGWFKIEWSSRRSVVSCNNFKLMEDYGSLNCSLLNTVLDLIEDNTPN